MKCFICKMEMNKNGENHLYKCLSSSDLNITRKEAKFKNICFNYNKEFNREELETLYQNDSLVGISNTLGVSYQHCVFLLKHFEIKHRNISEANKHISRQEKSLTTIKDKYGEDITNVSQIDAIKNKKKNTFLKNYGVDNIWKSEKYYEWLHNFMFEKYGSKSLPNRYGGKNKWWEQFDKKQRTQMTAPWHQGYIKWYDSLSEEEKTDLIQRRCKTIAKNYNSSIERKILNILELLGISYQRQFWINRKSYDFRISDVRIIIEVQGDFWHCNPDKYKADDIVKHSKDGILVKDVWEKDEQKKLLAEKYGYKVIYFWENEINKLNEEELKVLLLNKLGEFK